MDDWELVALGSRGGGMLCLRDGCYSWIGGDLFFFEKWICDMVDLVSLQMAVWFWATWVAFRSFQWNCSCC